MIRTSTRWTKLYVVKANELSYLCQVQGPTRHNCTASCIIRATVQQTQEVIDSKIKRRDVRGWSQQCKGHDILSAAVRGGYLEIVVPLLRTGALMNIPKGSCLALQKAARADHLGCQDIEDAGPMGIFPAYWPARGEDRHLAESRNHNNSFT